MDGWREKPKEIDPTAPVRLDWRDRVPIGGVAHDGPRADWRAELVSRSLLEAG